MSYQSNGGSYLPTGYPTQNGGSPNERSPKRQKMSPPAPSVTFKTPAPRYSHAQGSSQQQGKHQQDDQESTKRTDINDIGDLLFNSGVNEKQEEEFLLQSYRREQQAPPTNNSFLNHQSYRPQQSSNFDLLSSGSFPSIGQRPGNLGAPVKSEDEISQELEEKQRVAIRERNEAHQREMENPFLYGSSMRSRMERIANDNGIKIPMTGLFDKINKGKEGENKEVKEMKHAEEGGGSIVQMEKAPSILNKGVPLDHIMSLLSLAASERIRNLIEDAFALTRGRQITSDGVVPEEWTDLAAPPPQPEATQTNGDTPHTEPSKPQRPFSVADALAHITRADRQAEERRLKKRAERRARKEAAANAGSAGANGETSVNGALTNGSGNTPGPNNLIAPEPKMTKKERERLAKQDVSEEVQMKQANSALNMALGGGKKKYSWLTGGAGSKGGSGAGTPGLGGSRSGTPGLGAGPKAVKKVADPNELGKDGLPNKGFDRKFGVWREDGPEGKDVQLRDWVNALEIDGKEKRALASAMTRLGRERLIDDAA
ncbi:MAG: hypothetical protein Q9159_004570 [Coniocarpon cinnabarinum]